MIPTLQLGQFGRAVVESAAAAGSPPSDFSGLTLWIDGTDSTTLLDAAGGSQVTTDGQTVGLAKSKNGIARCVYQGAPANSPTYKTGIVNGKSVLRFDGSNDEMTVNALSGNDQGAQSSMSTLFGAGSLTIISALSVASAVAAQGDHYNNSALLGDGNAYFAIQLVNQDASNITVRIYNYDGTFDVASSGATPKNAFFIMSAKHTGGSIYIRVNSGSWTNAASGSNGGGASGIYFGRAFSTNRAALDLAHCALYNTALSDTDIGLIESYFAGQLGITL